ncbi:MAG: hypothetical protein IPL49_22060 [Saprospirales bacterium]|nr:hypothetical protein [Saprospirales bacterium]
MTGTITVVEPSSYPEYDIATVTTVDADGCWIHSASFANCRGSSTGSIFVVVRVYNL